MGHGAAADMGHRGVQSGLASGASLGGAGAERVGAVKIKGVDFAGAIARPGAKPPDRLKQIAFSGRSNVGKSSLINRLLGRTRARLARVSARPGKTREINFYRVRASLHDADEVEFFLVDLPGYGYARVPAAMRRGWKPLIEQYLRGTPDLAGVVQLIDARHDPTAEDREMARYLAALGVPTLFVVTKVDKLSRSRRESQLRRIVQQLGVDPDQVVPFSARTGEGRDHLLEALEDLLSEAREAA